jgi:hypothetical protein
MVEMKIKSTGEVPVLFLLYGGSSREIEPFI